MFSYKFMHIDDLDYVMTKLIQLYLVTNILFLTHLGTI